MANGASTTYPRWIATHRGTALQKSKGVVPAPHRRIEVDIPVVVEDGCNAVDVRVQSKRNDVFEDVHAEDDVEAPVNVEREQITIKY